MSTGAPRPTAISLILLSVLSAGCLTPSPSLENPIPEDQTAQVPPTPEPPARPTSITRPTLVFESESRRLLADNVLIWLNGPATRKHRVWSVTPTDKTLILDPLLRPEQVLGSSGHSLVILDAGHGGEDGGAVSHRGRKEKDLVLDIVHRTRETLLSFGIKVSLTRETDTNTSLPERTDVASRLKADLLVSVHLNFAESSKASGVETYVLTAPKYPSTVATGGILDKPSPASRYDAASMALAFQVHKSLVQKTRWADRGIKHARFDILRNAPCPVILVECGFLSHSHEESQLADPVQRRAIADAIARGIAAYTDIVKAARLSQGPH